MSPLANVVIGSVDTSQLNCTAYVFLYNMRNFLLPPVSRARRLHIKIACQAMPESTPAYIILSFSKLHFSCIRIVLIIDKTYKKYIYIFRFY